MCVLCERKDVCFVFAYQYLSKESGSSQSLWSSFQTFNHFKVVLRFGNTDLYDAMLYTCVCVKEELRPLSTLRPFFRYF